MSNMFGNERNRGYTASNSDFNATNMTWSSLVAWIASVGLILLAILVFIHFTLYPIFQFQPGGKGLIPVPGNKNYYTQWKPQTSDTLDTPQVDLSGALLGTPQSTNWAFTLDISIMCPLTPIKIGTNPGYRLLFARGGNEPAARTANTLDGVWTNYNVAVALVPTNNDLVISVLPTPAAGGSALNGESVVLKNVPVQTPFRLGVVIFANSFEVYMNGKLMETHIMATTVNSNDGRFIALNTRISDEDATPMTKIARVGNLIVWPLTPTPSELRYATPTLMPTIKEDSECGAVGSACAAEPINTTDLSNAISSLGRSAMRAQQANASAAAAAAEATLAQGRAITASGVAQSAQTAASEIYNSARARL